MPTYESGFKAEKKEIRGINSLQPVHVPQDHAIWLVPTAGPMVWTSRDRESKPVRSKLG